MPELSITPSDVRGKMHPLSLCLIDSLRPRGSRMPFTPLKNNSHVVFQKDPTSVGDYVILYNVGHQSQVYRLTSIPICISDANPQSHVGKAPFSIHRT